MEECVQHSVNSEEGTNTVQRRIGYQKRLKLSVSTVKLLWKNCRFGDGEEGKELNAYILRAFLKILLYFSDQRVGCICRGVYCDAALWVGFSGAHNLSQQLLIDLCHVWCNRCWILDQQTDYYHLQFSMCLGQSGSGPQDFGICSKNRVCQQSFCYPEEGELR